METKAPFIVVDDDLLNNMICKITIGMVMGNSEVKTFSGPEPALDYIQAVYVDQEDGSLSVILLDINMPTMSGWEFLERFKKFSDKTKSCFRIYMLSSSVDMRDKERAFADENVVDYLVKPLTKEMTKKIADLEFGN